MRSSLVVIAVLALAGCATAPAPTPSATPTVSATAVSSAAGQQPAQLFDGSCDNLFSGAEVTNAVGSAVSLRGTTGGNLGSYVLPQAGGLWCTWVGGGATVTFAVLPASAVSIPVTEGCAPYPEMAGLVCDLDVEANGVRLAGAVIGLNDSSSGEAAVTTLEQLLEQRTTGIEVPPPAPAGWAPLTDCEGLTTEWQGSASGFGDGYYVPAYRALRGADLGVCSFADADGVEVASVSVLGGARWVVPVIAATASAVQVDGLEGVYLGPVLSSGSRYIDVFDGTNWMQAFVTDADTAYPLLVALVAQLN